jgi:hypothetical protein
MGLIRRHAVTARGLAARRRNAQRSTGPRTPWGKARVSLNALRHGERSVHFRHYLRAVGLKPKFVFQLNRLMRLLSTSASTHRSGRRTGVLRIWLEKCWAEVAKWELEADPLISGPLEDTQRMPNKADMSRKINMIENKLTATDCRLELPLTEWGEE